MRLTDSAHSCVWLVSWERDVTKKSRMSCTRFIYDIISYMSYLSRDTIHITFDWSIIVFDLDLFVVLRKREKAGGGTMSLASAQASKRWDGIRSASTVGVCSSLLRSRI